MTVPEELIETGEIPDYPYPDIPNPDLLDRIPLTARVILDVGCGTGALGAAYKRLNPSCAFYGIESHADAAKIAAARLDGVAAIDVEAQSIPFVLDGRIDCLIYGDVLEHLRDPWRVLAEHAKLLSPTGLVLICVPNAEHWSMVARLLSNRFDYEASGLLDRQHIRFFTLQSMHRLLTDAELSVVDVTPRIFEPERNDRFHAAIAPALSAMNIDPAAYAMRANPTQYVWRASRTAVERLTVLSTMLEPVGGVSQVRVIDPLQALASVPGVRTGLFDLRNPPDLAGAGPTVMILHRPALLGEAGLAALSRFTNPGSSIPNCVVVTEFDDHPDYIPILQHASVWNFRGVHAVQTTTHPLAEVLRGQNPEVAVFPNAVRRLPAISNFADPGRLTLLFAGINREKDWPPLMDAINSVAIEMGERIRFIVVHDRGFFDALTTPHKSYLPMCDYATYLELLSSCELSFMPLLDNEFNRSKSDLKFVEAAAARVVAVASGTVYRDSIDDGRTGLIFTDGETLRQKMLGALADFDGTRRIADAARVYATSRMLASQVAARVAWYRSLWHRRADLSAELAKRISNPN